MKALKTQKEILSQKIAREKIITKLPKLSKQIIELIKQHGELSISDIETITKANRNTIKVRLRELVSDHYLVKLGKGKGTRYIIGS